MDAGRLRLDRGWSGRKVTRHITITISVTKFHCVSYWWCDNTLGLKYTDVGSATDAQDYYDDMAVEYTKVVRAWGYNCPHVMI